MVAMANASSRLRQYPASMPRIPPTNIPKRGAASPTARDTLAPRTSLVKMSRPMVSVARRYTPLADSPVSPEPFAEAFDTCPGGALGFDQSMRSYSTNGTHSAKAMADDGRTSERMFSQASSDTGT